MRKTFTAAAAAALLTLAVAAVTATAAEAYISDSQAVATAQSGTRPVADQQFLAATGQRCHASFVYWQSVTHFADGHARVHATWWSAYQGYEEAFAVNVYGSGTSTWLNMGDGDWWWGGVIRNPAAGGTYC
jgi:hypothetical protein